MRNLELEANKLLEASGFSTHFNAESRAIDSNINASSRSVGEVTVKSKTSEVLSYLDVVDTLAFYETVEGRAVLAHVKAERAKRAQNIANTTMTANRSKDRALAKKVKAAQRRAELGKALPHDAALLA